MERIELQGGVPLRGQVRVGGAKNACLTLMPAALLSDQPVRLTNVPDLVDIATMADLLRSLGVDVEWDRDGARATVTAGGTLDHRAPYDIVRKMRASFLVLGPLLAREGVAEVSRPGGCAIGERDVEQHVAAMQALGAELELVDGYVHASVTGGLQGARFEFPFVTVGGTENMLMACVLARGESEIVNAAREPEIVALADLLIRMGAKIEGAGTGTIRVQGVDRLHGAELWVIPDRIEFGTYMVAAAITDGELELCGGRLEDLECAVGAYEQAGVEIWPNGDTVHVRRQPAGLQPLQLRTGPYPEFPTDLQAQTMALMTLATGESRIEESIFEHRFMHVPELNRMGADIAVHGSVATVRGVPALHGAPVMATDLRASMSLILAGLAAEGTTTINRPYHLFRGYEHPVEKLAACGANIRCVTD